MRQACLAPAAGTSCPWGRLPPRAVGWNGEDLTQRETQILSLLMTGSSDREIAHELRVAPGTVRKHLDNLYRKHGVRRRAQAVAMALELLPPPTGRSAATTTGAGSATG
jgi:ATP/maltotriose-dependent transcriptional regulator MalT